MYNIIYHDSLASYHEAWVSYETIGVFVSTEEANLFIEAHGRFFNTSFVKWVIVPVVIPTISPLGFTRALTPKVICQ